MIMKHKKDKRKIYKDNGHKHIIHQLLNKTGIHGGNNQTSLIQMLL